MAATEKESAKRNEDVSRTKKIVNMLADNTAATAAARTLANAASQEGKLISDYLMERLHRDYARPVTVSDKIKSWRPGRQAGGKGEVCALRTAADLQGA
jgi:hypothetical protein